MSACCLIHSMPSFAAPFYAFLCALAQVTNPVIDTHKQWLPSMTQNRDDHPRTMTTAHPQNPQTTRSSHLNHSQTTTANHTKCAQLPTNNLPTTWNVHPIHPHWGSCSAPQLPFPWLSNPHKAAWQCRLTLALPLWGSLVIFGGMTLCRLGYPWVFVNPLPVPMKTCTCGHRYGFWWVQAWVTLENPRVACYIPYLPSYPLHAFICCPFCWHKTTWPHVSQLWHMLCLIHSPLHHMLCLHLAASLCKYAYIVARTMPVGI